MDRRTFGRSLLAAAGLTLTDPLRAAAQWQRMQPRVDGDRLLRHFFALAEYGATPDGGIHRVAYGEADLRARRYVLDLMREAQLEVSVDAAGNLLGRRAGSEPGLKPLVFGSHIDSVPYGGRYDGPVGSLAAIEAARTLVEAGIATRHPLEVVVFQNEEGGLIGSEALIGEVGEHELELMSHSGVTIREGTRLIGGDPERLASVQRRPGDIAAYLELHIEQGGVLEREGIDIGVVEGIVGIGWWDVTWAGFANHAGTTPMDQRRDALLAASRFVQAVNDVALALPGRHVATVGRIEAEPGAPNVIPGRVTTSLEIRDLDDDTIRELFTRIEARARQIARESGTEVHFEELIRLQPALADPRVQQAIAGAAEEVGLSHRRLPSGAGHDAQSMARLGPMGMIFVPSVGGISHAPSEFTEEHDVVNGANVLLGALLRLDGSLR